MTQIQGSQFDHALDLKYRPTNFLGLTGTIGQETTARSLKKAVLQDQISKAYLFAGHHGCGKTTLARVLGAALNCPFKEAGEPCGVCESCTRIMQGRENMDVVEFDAASHGGVDDARDLRQKALYAASEESRFKVYIIDEAHMLTREAWNSILKLLEEPPPRVVFVFATTDPEKIKNSCPAALSRMVRYDFKPITEENVVRRLRSIAEQEGINISDDALRFIADKTKGAMRDALRDMGESRNFSNEEVTVSKLRERFGFSPENLQLLTIDILSQGSRGRAYKMENKILEDGMDYHRYFQSCLKTLNDLHKIKEGVPVKGWSDEAMSGLTKRKESLSAEEITACVKLGLNISEHFKGDNPPNIVFSTYFQEAISAIESIRSRAE